MLENSLFHRMQFQPVDLCAMRKVLFLCLFLYLLTVLPATAGASEKTVHVVTALCDNINQRIVPVPPALGNGRDLKGNLYWGAAYGVKTYMRKQKGWRLAASETGVSSDILERIVLRNDALKTTIIADAYKGSAIKQATKDFLKYCAGKEKFLYAYADGTVAAGGNAGLVVYVGHNGLMDFSLWFPPSRADDGKRDAAIFACRSKEYFLPILQKAGAFPLVWTTGNMAPEAYTLHALVHAWAEEKKPESVRKAVAAAYNRYQKCGINGAMRLFASGY